MVKGIRKSNFEINTYYVIYNLIFGLEAIKIDNLWVDKKDWKKLKTCIMKHWLLTININVKLIIINIY